MAGGGGGGGGGQEWCPQGEVRLYTINDLFLITKEKAQLKRKGT